MNKSLVLVKNIGRALMTFVGGPVGLVGTFLLDMADDAMEGACQEAGEKELREEIALLKASLASAELQQEYREDVDQTVDQLAHGKTPSEREQIKTYLYQLPYTIERTLATPTDPTGDRTLRAMTLHSGMDLLPLLPTSLPNPELQAGKNPPGLPFIRLERFLGNGGMGDVWLAKDQSLPPDRQQIVLKFCRDPRQAGLLLQHEATLNFLLQGDQHLPGVVRLEAAYFVGQHCEYPPCLKYEYIAGGTLTELVRDWYAERERPSAQFIGETIQQLARTVGHFHSLPRPIVHRDLKPANILVHRQSQSQFLLKIADFGIGGLAADQQIRETRTQSNTTHHLPSMLRGSHSALYASRQQRDGEPPDPRDDVYALGVIWYQLLLGNVSEEISATWDEELEDAGVRLPPSQAQLLRSCLRARREGRPATAAALADELARLLEAVPQQTAFPSTESLKQIAPPVEPLQGNPLTRIKKQFPLEEPAETSSRRKNPSSVPQAQAASLQLPPAPKAVPEPQRVEVRYPAAASLGKRHFPQSPADFSGTAPGEIWVSETLGTEFCWCPAGTFLMGSPREEPGRLRDEDQVQVEIPHGFWVAKFPVTQREWTAIMKTTVRAQRKKHDNSQIYIGEGDEFPMTSVDWKEALHFCKEWTERERGGALSRGWGFRLPTEAEWEYACRAGSMTATPYGDSLDGVSLNCADRLKRLCPVGSSPPNAWGLHDMLGNVWEWCLGEYTSQLPGGNMPQRPGHGVCRGGSYQSDLRFCRSAQRMSKYHNSRQLDLGFRVILAPRTLLPKTDRNSQSPRSEAVDRKPGEKDLDRFQDSKNRQD